ncbi:MAG: polymer-forming cytoskeletal protein [Gammaproteobacteria bacterium]|nr:polymer-forming cytoskeletal protein [Gammaproteobacteria bacterium]
MFNTKKPETTTPSITPTISATPKPAPSARENIDQQPVVNSRQEPKGKAVISKGCFIKGEISGTEDIDIFGQVEGVISLKNNIISIEKSSKVKANIDANIVNITGNVVGNINANEKIVIHDEGNVTGDMNAPRIILEDGSHFKGNVSMTDNKVNATPINKDSKTPTNKPI